MKLHSSLSIIAVPLILVRGKCTVSSTMGMLVDQNCGCGEIGDDLLTRIVGGGEAVPHMYPWIVPIFRNGSFHCAGSIINNRYILTAGHCADNSDPRDLSVGLGVHDISMTDEYATIGVEKVIMHNNFVTDGSRHTNDLALLKLVQPITLSDTVKVICLPSKDTVNTGDVLKIAGWGRIGKGAPPSNVLREATVRMVSFQDCLNSPVGPHLAASMICAYGDGADHCSGDSGGPLSRQRDDGRIEQIGIISWGFGCTRNDTPGVYVKNYDYVDWILYNTQDGVYCMDPPIQS